MSGDVVLEAQGIVKRYGPRTVVDAAHLEVKRGESWAILGPNGAGKSTLCRILALLDAPDGGVVRLFGSEEGALGMDGRRRTAMVFQRPILFQGRVRANVELGLRFRRMKRNRRHEAVENALALVGATSLADADVRTLSGGELQRVALARALVLEPEILFLDEPTSNLDVALRRQFREDVHNAASRVAATVLVVTHDLTEALQLATHLAVMAEGRLLRQGPAAEVMDCPRLEAVARCVGMETFWEGRVERCEGDSSLVVTTAGVPVWVGARLAAGSQVRLALRPEDVTVGVADGGLCTAPGKETAPGVNLWRACIQSLTPASNGENVRLCVEGAVPGATAEPGLVAQVTRPVARGLGLQPGSRVEVGVDPYCVAVIAEG